MTHPSHGLQSAIVGLACGPPPAQLFCEFCHCREELLLRWFKEDQGVASGSVAVHDLGTELSTVSTGIFFTYWRKCRTFWGIMEATNHSFRA